VLHEWFGVAAHEHANAGAGDSVPCSSPAGTARGQSVAAARPASNAKQSDEAGKRCCWLPPLGILVHLARMATLAEPFRCVVWVGRRCWPYLHALAVDEGGGGRGLWSQSIFVDPGSDAERVWAIDLALRNPAVAAVVADASRLKMPQSRRLQTSAMAGAMKGEGGALALLARPSWELREHSVAATRWLVQAEPTVDEDDEQPRWAVELLRCKGVQPVKEGARRWTVQRDHETGTVRLAADVCGQSCATPVRAMRHIA
jgi:hypothetical protein